MIAATVGSVLMFGMTKNIVHLNQVSTNFQNDINIAQAQREITATLITPPPCSNPPCDSFCTKTFGDNNFDYSSDSFTHLYLGDNIPPYVVQSVEDSDLADDEVRTNIGGVYIKNFELKRTNNNDNVVNLKVTLGVPGDNNDRLSDYRKNRVFTIPIAINRRRADNQNDDDYNKIRECSFVSPSSQDNRQNKCRDEDGNVVEGAPHINGGGFVASTASVHNTAFVGYYASVCDRAKVKGNAKIYGHARVFGQVYDHAEVYESAYVGSHSYVYGYAKVYGSAHLLGSGVGTGVKVYGGDAQNPGAEVYGHASLNDNVSVYHNAKVYGNARMTEYAKVYGSSDLSKAGAEVYGFVQMRGEAKVYKGAKVCGSVKLRHNAEVYEKAHVSSSNNEWTIVEGNSKVYDRAQVSGGTFHSAKIYGTAKISVKQGGTVRVDYTTIAGGQIEGGNININIADPYKTFWFIKVCGDINKMPGDDVPADNPDCDPIPDRLCPDSEPDD